MAKVVHELSFEEIYESIKNWRETNKMVTAHESLDIDEIVSNAMILIDPLGQHKEYFELIKHIIVTFKKKNNDYAGSDAHDFMKNFARCENFGIDMVSGIVTRMSDKITRMENLFRLRNQQVKDESLEDTILDLANYCLLLVVAMRRSNGMQVGPIHIPKYKTIEVKNGEEPIGLIPLSPFKVNETKFADSRNNFVFDGRLF